MTDRWVRRDTQSHHRKKEKKPGGATSKPARNSFIWHCYQQSLFQFYGCAICCLIAEIVWGTALICIVCLKLFATDTAIGFGWVLGCPQYKWRVLIGWYRPVLPNGLAFEPNLWSHVAETVQLVKRRCSCQLIGLFIEDWPFTFHLSPQHCLCPDFPCGMTLARPWDHIIA